MTSHEQMQADRHKRDRIVMERHLARDKAARLRECLEKWSLRDEFQ